MIEPMKKYACLVYHQEYLPFLQGLQAVGAMHVVERRAGMDETEVKSAEQFIKKVDNLLNDLQQRKHPETPETFAGAGEELAQDLMEMLEEEEKLTQQIKRLQHQREQDQVWGSYDGELINRLKQKGINFYLFEVKKGKWKANWEEQVAVDFLHKTPQARYGVVISDGEKPNWQEVKWRDFPEKSLMLLDKEQKEKETLLAQLSQQIDLHAQQHLEVLRQTKADVLSKLNFDKVLLNTERSSENRLMVLEGYVPASREEAVNTFLEESGVFYLADQPTEDEPVPIKLRNSRFSQLFEPITKLFALPGYNELDLTPFFAPFFLLFFGFCLGDTGYGLLLFLGATALKFKLDKSYRPYLTLAQVLAIPTMLFGAWSGTVFGIALVEEPSLSSLHAYFLDYDSMFNLALGLGVAQIMFGLGVQAWQKWKFDGLQHALAPIGWLVLIISLLDVYLVFFLPEITQYTGWLGVAFVFLFSSPEGSIGARIGGGIWGLYGITGIFGDVLSYIRLFALGVSTSILGLVINSIAWQFGQSPYVGPVVMAIILILGHGLNLAIALLGAFVHPMRLTFVEFYKNAGFKGGGVAYQPFKRATVKSDN
ncbi:MAG: V-type ATPase 116kDa subunit family protein [Bacteroidota bacterium]